ncbi:hypothetical protein [Saccharothrix sp. ALI-22-I]|uniref:hypothetical protein n=1 Tax=Saccharothrix sp. ALI-22-I TaxID=1933778 RepID=UPI0015C3DFAF|nr:hypothetical protein [Saccharothrix sp. ALI-22-I]
MIAASAGGDGVDLERHAGQGERGDAEEGPGGWRVAPDAGDAVREHGQPVGVVVDDVGARSCDVAVVEAGGAQGDAEVGEGPRPSSWSPLWPDPGHPVSRIVAEIYRFAI